MKVIAPGKLLLTGAYAVLEGAPAVVAAIDRHAVVDFSRVSERPTAELRAAFGEADAPWFDAGALYDGPGRKLGLGSSAAVLVAALGARELARGEDLRAATVRERVFSLARRAHAAAQGGGSGVDVAASVHGGLLRYAVRPDGQGVALSLAWPAELWAIAYDSGVSVRTSDMVGAFQRTKERSGAGSELASLMRSAEHAAGAIARGDVAGFVARARDYGRALGALGALVDVPILPPRFAELATLAEADGGAFVPSGAGGGDVAVWLGLRPPPEAFARRATELSFRRLDLALDAVGLRAATDTQ